MLGFINELSTLDQAYWACAIVGSVIIGVFALLTIVGGGVDVDMIADATVFQADDGGVGFQFFTIKGAFGFVTVFGWTGVSCLDSGYSSQSTFLISFAAGLAMMFATALLFHWFQKLTEQGTLNVKNAIGKTGTVYIPIGKNRSNFGKIHLNFQGGLHELAAITNDIEDLKTGTLVKVLQIVSEELILVEKITNIKS